MIIQRADIFGDRHFVVVQHHQQIGFDIARMVHRLKRHTCGNGTVANDADRTPLFVFFRRGNRHSDTRRNGG